jgi:hypothetical protein
VYINIGGNIIMKNVVRWLINIFFSILVVDVIYGLVLNIVNDFSIVNLITDIIFAAAVTPILYGMCSSTKTILLGDPLQ